MLQTALDLLEKGIDVHVLADGVSSANGDEVGLAIKVRTGVFHELGIEETHCISAHMQRMRDSGAQITTSESILFQILRALPLLGRSQPRTRALTCPRSHLGRRCRPSGLQGSDRPHQGVRPDHPRLLAKVDRRSWLLSFPLTK